MTDEETELRVLLERVVPQLPAPAQRLERVRERVRRRRRRRAVGLSTTAVLAVAAAGLLLPGGEADSGAPGPARTTTLAPAVSGRVRPVTPPSSLPPSNPAVPFKELAGLRLRLPRGWSTLSPPGQPAVYVSSQRLGLPKDDCLHPRDDFCTPLVTKLVRGGALVKLDLLFNKARADKTRSLGPSVGTESVLQACRTVGGTEQSGVLITDASGSDLLVEATLCLSRPTASQRARTRDLLLNASFG